MIGPILVIAGVAAVFGTIFWMLWSQRAVAERRVGAPDTVPERVFIGGVLWRSGGSGPAKLELHAWGIRVRGRMLTRRFMPIWEAGYGELACVQFATKPIGSSGAWIRLKSSDESMIFWTMIYEEVLRQFERRSVPVDHSAARIRNMYDMNSKP
jgi:hypothetical protein